MRCWIITLTLLMTIPFTMCACSHENEEVGHIEGLSPAPNPDQAGNNDDNSNAQCDMDIDYSNFPLSEGKNGQAPTIRLNSGSVRPIGCMPSYCLTGDVWVNSVISSIILCFRRINTDHL